MFLSSAWGQPHSTSSKLNKPYVFLKHLDGFHEGYDNIGGGDVSYNEPPQSEKILFYSKNDLTMPLIPDGKLTRDVRSVGSTSTFTLPFEGENLITPPVDTTLYFENRLAPEANNAIAFFYNNAKGPEDPTFSTDPNWVYSGTVIDAQEAGKTPTVSYVTVLVQNGLSNIMQLKFFPPEDVNFSGTVDMSDFSALASNWQTIYGTNVRTASSPTDHPEYYTDINKDGTEDILDLAELCSCWLWEKPVYEIDQYDPIF